MFPIATTVRFEKLLWLEDLFEDPQEHLELS
jgi:hypothetical protein